MSHHLRLGRSLAILFFAIVFGIALSPPSHAHNLSITATVSDSTIQGKVFYASGDAAGLHVHAIDADGKVLSETTSGADGRFTLPAPATYPVTVVAETDDGHRGEISLEAPNAHTEHQLENAESFSPAASVTEDRVRAIVQEELRPIHEHVAEQASRTRARDIFGGIGYILGVFGLIILLKRSSGKRS